MQVDTASSYAIGREGCVKIISIAKRQDKRQCASVIGDYSPLLLHANGKPLYTNIVTMIVIFPVKAISSYRVTFGKQTRSARFKAKNIDKIYNTLKGNRESNASFRFSG